MMFCKKPFTINNTDLSVPKKITTICYETVRKIPEPMPEIQTITLISADSLVNVIPCSNETMYGDFSQIRIDKIMAFAMPIVELLNDHLGSNIVSCYPFEKLISNNQLVWGVMIGIKKEDLEDHVLDEMQGMSYIFSVEVSRRKFSIHGLQDAFCSPDIAKLAINKADDFLRNNYSGKPITVPCNVVSGEQKVQLNGRYYKMPEEDEKDLGNISVFGYIDFVSIFNRKYYIMKEGKKLYEVHFNSENYPIIHQHHTVDCPTLCHSLNVREKNGKKKYYFVDLDAEIKHEMNEEQSMLDLLH